MKLTINLSDEETKILQKRAKKNYLSLIEQAEDIIRRSCINMKSDTASKFKTDDALVEIFSREYRKKKKL